MALLVLAYVYFLTVLSLGFCPPPPAKKQNNLSCCIWSTVIHIFSRGVSQDVCDTASRAFVIIGAGLPIGYRSGHRKQLSCVL